MILVLAAVLALAAPQAQPRTSTTAACAAKGGTVRPVCMSRTLTCVAPYPDAGRPCTDKSQCKGKCFLTGPYPRSPLTTKVVGRCQRNDDPCGCFSTIVKGRVAGGICVD